MAVKTNDINTILDDLGELAPLISLIPKLGFFQYAHLTVKYVVKFLSKRGIIKDDIQENIRDDFENVMVNVLQRTAEKIYSSEYKAFLDDTYARLENSDVLGDTKKNISFDELSEQVKKCMEESIRTEKYKIIPAHVNEFVYKVHEAFAVELYNYPNYAGYINYKTVISIKKVIDDVLIKFINSQTEIQCLRKKIDNLYEKLEALQKKLPIYNLLRAKYSLGIKDLIGRDDDIKKIDEYLESERPIVLIDGMGGVGKSELCRKYCEKHDNSKLAWFDFSVNLRETISVLIDNNVEPKQMEIEINKVEEFLQSLDKSYLMVFDNVENLCQSESDFIRSLNCKVLITTRKKYDGLEDILYLYPLKLLSGKSCIRLFDHYSKKKHKKEEEDDLKEIIKRTGHHTLAIELLGKIIKSKFGPNTVKEILHELQIKSFALNDVIMRNGDVEDKEFINHMISLFDISKIADDKEKMYLLKNLCILPSLPVENKKLLEWLGEEHKNELRELTVLGWLDAKETEITMHNVICETLKVKVSPSYDDCKTLIIKLKDEINYENEIEKYNPPYFVQCVEVGSYFKNKSTQNIKICSLYHNIGLRYDDRGEYDNALKWYIESIAIKKVICGSEHETTALGYNNIAVVYRAKGEYDKSLEYHKKALKIRKKVLGEEHYDTAVSNNNIGVVYKDKGEYGQALKYYNKNLKRGKIKLETEHSLTSMTYNNIAGVYKAKGDYTKALDYNMKALNIRKKELDKDHPDIGTTCNDIALLYIRLGDLEQSLAYQIKAKDIYRKVLGEKHPWTAAAYNNTAGLYEDMGDYEEALKYYTKALEIKENVLGVSHPKTAMSYNNIALLYRDMKDFDQAFRMMIKALYFHTKAFGGNHPTSQRFFERLQSIYNKSGKPMDQFDNWLKSELDKLRE